MEKTATDQTSKRSSKTKPSTIQPPPLTGINKVPASGSLFAWEPGNIIIQAMLARAAEQGARRALADVGLDGPEAAIDIHDLRTLLDSLRMARRTAWQTVIRLITTGLLLALIAGIAVKLKLFG